MPAPVSKAQARLFGAIASGAVKKKGFPASEAKKRLEGVKVGSLPSRANKKTHARKLREKFDKLPRLNRELPPEKASAPKKVDREAYFKKLKAKHRKRAIQAFMKTA